MVTHGALAEIIGVELTRIPADDCEQRERLLRVAFGVVEADTYQEFARSERLRKRLARESAEGQAPF